jgi:hypothetical protein
METLRAFVLGSIAVAIAFVLALELEGCAASGAAIDPAVERPAELLP